jgi:hypothetical protein
MEKARFVQNLVSEKLELRLQLEHREKHDELAFLASGHGQLD